MKSGFLVLLLALPVLAYVAWQVRAMSHLDVLASDPPAEKAAQSREQLAMMRMRAEKWANDVRTLEATALQYRQPTPGDVVFDGDCQSALKSLAARSADLTDLNKFLSDVSSPKYDGALKSKYEGWQESKEKLARDARAIDEWFVNSLAGIDGPESAAVAVNSFQKLLSTYASDTRFSDSNKVAAWKVQCRVEVIKALDAVAKEPYAKVLNLPLPLPAENESQDVRKALGAPRAIAEQVRLLKIELNQVEDARLTLPERLSKDVKAAQRRADEWAAKEELLALFADPEPLNKPARVGEWLARVETQFNRTQTDGERGLIRKKVQQFCAAFIPSSARLDSLVLIKGEETPRSGVTIEYDSDAKSQPLTDLLDDLNEFNFKNRYANPDRIVWANGSKFTGTFDVLQPTPKTLAARDYATARGAIAVWSAKELAYLKARCEGEGKPAPEQAARRAYLDQLVGYAPPNSPGRPVWTKDNSRLWMRLTALSEAMEKFPTLFEASP
jgi:hypothetical protein